MTQVANGGYFGAPLAIQSVHYDGYHGVLWRCDGALSSLHAIVYL